MHFRVRKPLYLRYRTLRYPEANRARDNLGADVQLNGQLYAVFCLPLARSPGFNFLAFVSFMTTLRIFSISFLLRMCQQQTVLERPGKVRARHCIAGRVVSQQSWFELSCFGEFYDYIENILDLIFTPYVSAANCLGTGWQICVLGTISLAV